MRFWVIHEVRFETAVEAASEKEAERIAASIPYSEWEKSFSVREECVALEENPLNPRAGG